MSVKVGKAAPEFEAEAWVHGAYGAQRVTLAEYRGKWIVLFFYPRDFTFICPTEIAAFGDLEEAFVAEGAAVIGASTDSFYSHKAWFESHPRLQQVRYPILADTSQQVSAAYDVLLDDGATLRGTFIIDPEGITRHISINELDVGRNVEETLRVLKALRTGALCPQGWQPGQATLTTTDEWLASALPRLSEKVLADTAQRFRTREYAAGDTVFEQGDAPRNFFIIASGEADIITRLPDGEEKTLITLGPGDYFGEIGILTEVRRTATVRARSELKLSVLDWKEFREVIERSEETSSDFAEIVRERLRRSASAAEEQSGDGEALRWSEFLRSAAREACYSCQNNGFHPLALHHEFLLAPYHLSVHRRNLTTAYRRQVAAERLQSASFIIGVLLLRLITGIHPQSRSS